MVVRVSVAVLADLPLRVGVPVRVLAPRAALPEDLHSHLEMAVIIVVAARVARQVVSHLRVGVAVREYLRQVAAPAAFRLSWEAVVV